MTLQSPLLLVELENSLKKRHDQSLSGSAMVCLPYSSSPKSIYVSQVIVASENNIHVSLFAINNGAIDGKVADSPIALPLRL